MARWRTGRRSCKVGVEPHDTNRADEEARDISTSRADVDSPKPATAQCVAGIEASVCMPALGRTDMTKKSTAELDALQSRRLSERLMPRHRGPAANPGLSCTAVSRFVAARLSHMRYTGGVTGYLEVLTNETNTFAAELALARATVRGTGRRVAAMRVEKLLLPDRPSSTETKRRPWLSR